MKLCVLDIETNIHTGKPVVVTLLTPEDSVELLTVAENNFGILKDFLANPEVVFLGHNIAFDFAALQTHLPELRPLIWAAYEAGRISDTMIREKVRKIIDRIPNGELSAMLGIASGQPKTKR